MPLLLLFAFISGLVTIFAPCIWPILPIIFSTTATGGRSKALGVSLGIVTSFAVFTLTLSYLVSFFKFDPNILRLFAVIVLLFLGASLIIPALTGKLEVFFGKLSGLIKIKQKGNQSGFLSGFLTGLTLGIVWSPCAGPILSTIATLSATRAVNSGIILVTLAYCLGVFLVLFVFSVSGSALFNKSRLLSKYTGTVQKIFGFIIIITAILIFTNYDKTIQVKLLDAVPAYSSLIYKLEGIEPVSRELLKLKQNQDKKVIQNLGKPMNPVVNLGGSTLPNLGKATEFAGISKWLNLSAGRQVPDKPLTMAELKGKVVLVDFWTYTCINCIRTLPHVVGWYEKYKNNNFIVIGVHTPEFEFEKKTENVENAIKQYKINYPVAQDNDYNTWTAFNNNYWPAKYLIDKDGNLRKTHFGEGGYEEMEMAIRDLLKDAGQEPENINIDKTDDTPQGMRTPESYLGFDRMDRFYSTPEFSLGEKNYKPKENLPIHYIAYSGKWNIENEFAEAESGANLYINFYAEKVFLVLHPKNPGEKIKTYLDEKEYGNISITDPKLYELVNLKGKTGQHILRIEFLNPGTDVYAFTFG